MTWSISKMVFAIKDSAVCWWLNIILNIDTVFEIKATFKESLCCLGGNILIKQVSPKQLREQSFVNKLQLFWGSATTQAHFLVSTVNNTLVLSFPFLDYGF